MPIFQQGGAEFLTEQGLPESPVARALVCGMHTCPPPTQLWPFWGSPLPWSWHPSCTSVIPVGKDRVGRGLCDPSGQGQGGQRTLCQTLGCCPASPPPPSRRADASGTQWKRLLEIPVKQRAPFMTKKVPFPTTSRTLKQTAAKHTDPRKQLGKKSLHLSLG